ncbi:Zinc/iron permease [Trametopsis cervina]|nr:Zinc/iron permease [Trametopsis cervina]
MLQKVRDTEEFGLKVGVSLGIFAVSFFAVSFPSISKRVKSLRIPSLVFFLGKHFGTGVILSTGFVHLLPDAFNALRSKWTGFIILSSLLSIFLVEYLTTAYVDHLHSYSSAPPSPSSSPSPSPSRSSSITRKQARDSTDEQTPLLNSSTVEHGYAVVNDNSDTRQVVPVVEVRPSRSCASSVKHAATNGSEDTIFGGAHHRHEPRSAHASHSLSVGRTGGVAVGKKVAAVVLYDEDDEGTGQRESRIEVERQSRASHHHHSDQHQHQHHAPSHSHSHSHSHGHGLGHSHGNGHAHVHMENWDPEASIIHDEEEDTEAVRVGRRRQVVGILMLQIGIMLHSLVIGLTLSVSAGSEFTTLVTAILFHQLFEGLSLGIRIAGLPSDSSQNAFSRLPSRVLKPLLTLTFALTTPLGIWIGLAAFSSSPSHPSGSHRLKEIQGVLSAMSAGMLIYAACVEMLAGDFVMDPTMWRSGARRQVMALVSLVAGVAAMSAIE